ncbi:hypothetical protein [Luteibacter sp. UNCMF366Tsu5.1]|uniref:hypothetical protein n=1 Tax=Luteibacter sp. UNCMF366Tsu5.1 TaxID=1502758 RepID=UPI0009090092|nr:hypothetical protein [Luteibacter sp. UNCMF366Tsu5.1]SFW21065.1 hypothetical protein SAMN02800691_0301 [Luteibacter sp. UNCMF366Tsu5.1]
MRPCKPVILLSLLLSTPVVAQVAPATPPANAPVKNAPSPARPSSMQHPAAAPLSPASDAGATERGLPPVMPGKPGVTTEVQDANAHDRDAQGHLLDSRGQPVGQMPAPASTR